MADNDVKPEDCEQVLRQFVDSRRYFEAELASRKAYMVEFFDIYNGQFTLKGGAKLDFQGRIKMSLEDSARYETKTHAIDLESLNKAVELTYAHWLQKAAEEYAFERDTGSDPNSAYTGAMRPLIRLVKALTAGNVQEDPLFKRLLRNVGK